MKKLLCALCLVLVLGSLAGCADKNSGKAKGAKLADDDAIFTVSYNYIRPSTTTTSPATARSMASSRSRKTTTARTRSGRIARHTKKKWPTARPASWNIWMTS